MKKLAAMLMVVGATVMTGTAAHAYPPGSAIVEIVTGSPGPVNSGFRVRVNGCLAGEQVRFNLPANNRAPVIAVCTASNNLQQSVNQPLTGTATADMVHPAAAGTYQGTAELLTSQRTLPFNIVTTVSPTDVTVPATGGGESAETMIGIGIGAAALGAGLLLVARQRRREPAVA